MTFELRRQIHQESIAGVKQADLARRYSVAQSTISRVLAERLPKDSGYLEILPAETRRFGPKMRDQLRLAHRKNTFVDGIFIGHSDALADVRSCITELQIGSLRYAMRWPDYLAAIRYWEELREKKRSKAA